MDRPPRKWLKTGIALTAICIVTSVLLVALWISSYTREESVSLGIAGQRVGATSVKQRIIVVLLKEIQLPQGMPRRWHFGSRSIAESYPGKTDAEIIQQVGLPGFPGFSFYTLAGGGFRLVIPHWFAILFLAGLSALPWLPWRFSVRTLLIATTFIAVVLGLVVWVVRG